MLLYNSWNSSYEEPSDFTESLITFLCESTNTP